MTCYVITDRIIITLCLLFDENESALVARWLSQHRRGFTPSFVVYISRETWGGGGGEVLSLDEASFQTHSSSHKLQMLHRILRS